MSSDGSLVELYVERAMALKQARSERACDEAALHAVAHELGLTEEDLLEVRLFAEAHLKRRLHFLEVGYWHFAIEELTVAQALMPEEAPTLRALAEAKLGQWKQTGKRRARREAEALVRRSVAVEPGYRAAYALLSQLSELDAKMRLARREHLRIGLGYFWGFVVLLFLGSCAFVLW